jgi:ATP-dependent protease HslVU (ClpYQ) peptidase subunit
MTVLIAQNTKDKIILGADTGTFCGNYKTHLTNHKGRLKIMSVNDIIYSGTGSVAEIINFGLFCQTRKPERSDQLGIQRFFIDFGKWLKEQNIERDSIINNHYFLVFEKKLFHYQHNAVLEILEDDFATDGAGFKEAYMAMYLGKSVKEAIDLTIQMNVWASGEAQIVKIDKVTKAPAYYDKKKQNKDRPYIPSTGVIIKKGLC